MQGSFKVVCSIFDKNHDQAPKGEKLTGSNKLLFFAIAENLDENYNNVRIVVQKLKLSEIKCCYAADLKLINCLLGISSHSGKHACPFCEGEMSLEVGQLRTFGNLNFWHNKLKEDAEKSRNPESFIKRNMKNYMNVVNECMLRGDPETTILSTIPLPELHLLMGTVNWALVLIYKRVDKDNLQRRMRTKSITVHGYHGGGLDGGNSMQFLNELDFVFETLPEELEPVYTMLSRFRTVVKGCFGMELSSTFGEDIDEFKISVVNLLQYAHEVLKTKFEPTWKVHILYAHLKPFLEEKMVGLGIFCEQTSESAHCIAKPTQKRFKRRSDHKDHGKNLSRAACDLTAKAM